MSKIIKIVSGVFVVIVLTVVVVISTLDVNQYKGEIIEVAEKATGRKLQIGGDLQFALSFVPTVVIEDVKFSNASWGSEPEMLSLNKFEVQISLLALLGGNIQINRVVLLDPKILLETNKKGLGNWVFSSTKTDQEVATESEDSSSTIVINEVHLENAKIIYKDGITGKETKLVIDKIVTESDSADDPLSVIMKVAYNELPIEVKGTLGSLKQLTGNDNYPIDLVVNISDAKFALKGQIAKPMDGKGVDIKVSFNVDSLSQLSELAGSDLPELGPVSFTGEVSDSKGSYSVKIMKLLLGKTDLSGDVTANLSGKTPEITANLNSKLIDLIELTGDEQQVAKEAPKERLFSSEPLPLESLKSVNANVTISAEKIKTSSLVLDSTKVGITLKNGNLIIKPLSILLAGGSMNGTLGLNASGKTATLMTDITIKGIEPSLLGDLKDKISGATTDVSIKVKGRGNSVSQIMAGLNGQLLLQSAKGELKGSGASTATTDLLTMLNPMAKSSGGTQLDCAVVNFNIKNGIATANKGIAVSMTQMNVIGSGTIDLKTEKLDIGINPQAREGVGISAGQLADLVRLGGTLANPKPTTDVKAALSTGLSATTAIATGGLSLLAQGLLDRSTADDNPCATALGLKPATTGSKNSSTGKAVNTAKDAGSATLNKLKSLF